MKVRVSRNSFKDCPASSKTAGFTERTVVRLKIGAELDVHALSFFSGVTFLLVVDDLGTFSWLPAWLFELVDREIPSDWVIGLFNADPSAVIGPPIIASSLDAYSRFVEHDPDLVNAMRERIQSASGPCSGENQ